MYCNIQLVIIWYVLGFFVGPLGCVGRARSRERYVRGIHKTTPTCPDKIRVCLCVCLILVLNRKEGRIIDVIFALASCDVVGRVLAQARGE